MQSTNEWEADLLRVHNGELSFDVFAKRYDSKITKLSTRWGVREDLLSFYGDDDAKQDALIAIDRAIATWDEGQLPIGRHVCFRVKRHLQKLVIQSIRKGRTIEAIYLRTRAERFTWDVEVGRAEEIETALPADVYIDGVRRFHRLIGRLNARRADVVLQVADGCSVNEIRKNVYPNDTRWSGIQKVYRILRRAEEMATAL